MLSVNSAERDRSGAGFPDRSKSLLNKSDSSHKENKLTYGIAFSIASMNYK